MHLGRTYESKAMALSLYIQGARLQVTGLDLKWVLVFQYLGVWVDKNSTFRTEIKYLTD